MKLCSAITYVKAGSANPALQHVCSSRRSVYYTTETDTDTDRIPESFTIAYDNLEHRIFTSTENSMICFHCKNNGHPAKLCPLINDRKEEPTPAKVSSSSLKRHAPSTLSGNTDTIDQNVSEKEKENSQNANADHPTEKNKNDGEKTSDQFHESNQLIARSTNKHPARHPAKKLKPTTKKTHVQLMPDEIAKIKKRVDLFKQSDPLCWPHDLDDFINFIKNMKNTRDKTEYTQKYTNDLHNIIYMIEEIYPLVNASTKRTLTCFVKKLQETPDKDETTEESYETD